MNKYKRLGSNTILVFIGNIGSKMISFLMLPFYTKWLSTGDYGAFNLIAVYAGLLQGIVSLCISESIFIFPKGQSNKTKSEYFSSGIFVLILNIIITAFVFLILKLMFSTNNSTFLKYIWIIYGFTVSTFLQSYIQQFARSIDKIKVYSTTGIVLTACLALFSIILIPKYGLWGYFAAQLISYLIATLYSFFRINAHIYFSFNSIKKIRCKEMLKYSIPLIPNSVMWWIIGALSTPIMERYLGLEAIGIFSVANKLPGLITTIFTVFAISWQISVLDEFNKKGYKEFYNKILRVVFVGLVLFSFIISISSKFIISIMADESYFEAWKYIPILSMGVIFSSLSGFVGMNFSATRKSSYYFYSSLWGALSSIIFNFIFIPKFGLWGVSASFVLSHAIMAISRIIYSWKYVKIKSINIYIYMMLLNIGLILTIYFVNSLLLKSVVSLIIFAILLLINRSIFSDLKTMILSVIKKYTWI